MNFIVSIMLPAVRADGTPISNDEIASVSLSRDSSVVQSWSAPLAITLSYYDLGVESSPTYTATVTDTIGNVSAAGVGATPATLAAPVAPTLSVAQGSS